MIWKYFFGFFLCLKYCDCWNPATILQEKSRAVDAELIDVTNSIIEKYFLKRFSTINIITAVEDYNDHQVLDFQTELHRQNKGFCVYRLDKHRNIQTIRYRKKIYNVILLDNYKSFEVLLKSITTQNFNFRGHFLFVLLDGLSRFDARVFETLWKMNIINANAVYRHIAPRGGSSINVITYMPFAIDKCGSTSTETWKKILDGDKRVNWDDILPVKTKNLFGCPLRVVTFDRCPASCVESEEIVYGYDITILKIIAKKLKFKLNIKGLLGSEQWGDILANGSTTGAIERIVSNLADIGIGNYVLRQSRLNIMDSSVAYFSLPVVFAIPLGEKFTPFEKLLKPFKNMVWIMILIAFSIGAFVILIINWKFKKVRNFVYGTGIKNPTVNMLIAIFGGAQTKVPGRNFARFILMLFLLFCLVLRNVYQGTLFIFQQSDGRQKEVQSLKEMVEKNFTYFMYDSYSELTQNLPDVFKK